MQADSRPASEFGRPLALSVAQRLGRRVTPFALSVAQRFGRRVTPFALSVARRLGRRVTPFALSVAQRFGRRVTPFALSVARRLGRRVTPFALSVARRLGRRVTAAALIAVAMLLAGTAPAADYPTKPIRLVVPAAAGGGTDIVARLVGQGFTEAWRVPAVIDNRGGAGGVPGIAIVAKQSAADGYTLLVGSNGHLTFGPALYKRLPYDPRTDFAPISLLANQPFVVVVHPSVQAKSIAELIALAKKNPGKITYGSGGSGSAPHLGAALLQLSGGISMLHVPYKGSGLAIGAVMSGEIQVLVLGLATVLPLATTGKLRSLAVTTATRSRAAPDIPTVAESGLPGFDFDVWYGLAAPAGTPRDIIARLNREVVRLIRSPALAERYAAAGLEPMSNTPEQFAEQIRREIPKWQNVVKDANIAVE